MNEYCYLMLYKGTEDNHFIDAFSTIEKANEELNKKYSEISKYEMKLPYTTLVSELERSLIIKQKQEKFYIKKVKLL